MVLRRNGTLPMFRSGWTGGSDERAMIEVRFYDNRPPIVIYG